MPKYDQTFGEWVSGVLDRHGVSPRQAEVRTHVSYVTVNGMREGKIPGADVVIRFATGYGEDVPKALRMAGYGDIADSWEEGRQAATTPAPNGTTLSGQPSEAVVHMIDEETARKAIYELETLLKIFKQIARPRTDSTHDDKAGQSV